MCTQLQSPKALVRVVLVWLLAAPAFCGWTQEVDYKTTFADAEYYFLFNDAQEALPLYLRLHNENPDNANLLYRIGRSYLSIPGLKHKAIEPLSEAVKSINPSYQEGSYREVGAPPNAYFYLGEAYRIEGKFDKAIEAYNVFRQQLDAKDVYNLDYVDQQIQACLRADRMIDQSRKLQSNLVPIGQGESFIHGAALSHDSNTLLYTLKEKFYDAIYVCEKNEEGSWGTPHNITLDIGLEGELFSTSINSNGTEIFLFKNDNGTGNIYSSVKVDGQWQKAKKLGKPINTRYWETFASISPNGQTLYFSSNRRGGYGGLDIYQSSRLSNGDWGEAVNMGSNINTPHNEEAPYLSPDGSRLYFISQGHKSLGGYDVFYSQKLESGEWSTPLNLGYPISTPDDDMWYFPISTEEGIVSLVERGQPGISNLYQISLVNEVKPEMVTIKGHLQLANSYEVQGQLFNVVLVNPSTNDTIQQVNPEDISGLFAFDVTPGEYRIEAKGEGYVTESIPIAIPNTFAEPDFGVTINLKPQEVNAGKLLAIRSVLFDFDCDALSDEAVRELEKLYLFLHQNPTLEIEVCGHTDSKGSRAYNKGLSLRRAKSVVGYLTDRGIEPERLTVRGAGSMESIAQNKFPDGTDNPAGRRLNRRSSIRVLNSERNVDVVDELDVPEHLKIRVQNYTILLAPVNTNVDIDKLQVVNSQSGLESFRLIGRRNSFAYALGHFDHKSDAIAALNLAIDSGFTQASIVGEDDLKMLIE
jgi:outer membrane protein OmpA-like peptidoglycan-associated protein/tetratricopeptide (TPR) repeat protein